MDQFDGKSDGVIWGFQSFRIQLLRWILHGSLKQTDEFYFKGFTYPINQLIFEHMVIPPGCTNHSFNKLWWFHLHHPKYFSSSNSYEIAHGRSQIKEGIKLIYYLVVSTHAKKNI